MIYIGLITYAWLVDKDSYQSNNNLDWLIDDSFQLVQFYFDFQKMDCDEICVNSNQIRAGLVIVSNNNEV